MEAHNEAASPACQYKHQQVAQQTTCSDGVQYISVLNYTEKRANCVFNGNMCLVSQQDCYCHVPDTLAWTKKAGSPNFLVS